MFSRLEMLVGEEGIKKIKKAHIIVFGVGGVGGYVIESLVRSGIEHITIVDHDVVSTSNINRQIIANTKTVGRKKIDVMKERIHDIHPQCQVEALDIFYLPETAHLIHLENYDYVVDAIDTITAKILLAKTCEELQVPIISSMGTGNKMNPAMLQVSDIYKTSVCPLARVMRRELKKRHIQHLKVVYSKEEPIKNEKNQSLPGSNAFVPPSAGLLIASEVIKDIIK